MDGDKFRLTYVQACNDQRFANVIVYQQSGSDVGEPKSDLANAFLEILASGYASALSEQWEDRCVAVRKIGLVGQDFFRVAATGDPGLVEEEALPNQSVAQITLQPDSLGRSAAGRVFISGLPISYEKDNCLTPTGVTALNEIGLLLCSVIGPPSYASFRAGVLDKNGVFRAYTRYNVRTALTTQASRRHKIDC